MKSMEFLSKWKQGSEIEMNLLNSLYDEKKVGDIFNDKIGLALQLKGSELGKLNSIIRQICTEEVEQKRRITWKIEESLSTPQRECRQK